MMVVKVPTRCLDWCLPSVPHSPSSLKTLASSPSKRRTFFCSTGDGVIVCKYVHGHGANRLELVGFRRQKPYRTGSLEHSRARGDRHRSSCSTSSDSFLDDESSRKIQDMVKFSDKISSKNNSPANGVGGRIVPQRPKSRREESCSRISEYGDMKFLENSKPFECLEPPDWPERDEINLACVEQKFNSLEIPISVRMIQRKKQWKEGVKDIRESACTSVKKAFSSMVFIIQELHSCTLQMRELLFYEDLQGILGRAKKEIQASFVWLFQQVFSQTPSLMVSVMILLANYSVHSMANNAAIAYTLLPQAYAATTESVSVVVDDQSHVNHKFDLSEIKPFSVTPSDGKTTTSIGGGGGKSRPVVASSTDGEGRFDRVSSYSIIPDGASSIQNPSVTNEEESVSREFTKEEMRLWKSIKEEEAAKKQAVLRSGEALDRESQKKIQSPVHVKIEVDDYEVYRRSEMLYQMGLAQDPNNSLLLTNYAHLLFRVIHDYDRAEYYFKRAVKAKPKDAEALDKYGSFLWLVKKDMWGAEQAYLEAMDTDPSNTYYAANYANFLWNTGGEGTCLAT